MNVHSEALIAIATEAEITTAIASPPTAASIDLQDYDSYIFVEFTHSFVYSVAAGFENRNVTVTTSFSADLTADWNETVSQVVYADGFIIDGPEDDGSNPNRVDANNDGEPDWIDGQPRPTDYTSTIKFYDVFLSASASGSQSYQGLSTTMSYMSLPYTESGSGLNDQLLTNDTLVRLHNAARMPSGSLRFQLKNENFPFFLDPPRGMQRIP